MSASEVVGLCRTCNSLHAPGQCPWDGLDTAPQALPTCGECGCLHPPGACVQVQAARGTVRDAGAAPSGPLATVQHWQRLADQYHEQRDDALRQVERERAERRQAERERDEARAAHAEALAVLRRLRVAQRAYDMPGAIAACDAIDALLARHAPPAGPSRVTDGLPVRCPVCGRTIKTLTNGVCRECWEEQHDEAARLDALVETYPCGCRGTPGNRCPVHSAP